ncbi:DUF4255 domain-containing protein [Kutzneria sp. CA-103260]|uniref:DUF4255 domain-containing protein n=1 Tax=Kutzneria sp. CA-103260 TaxID=2802641 RepID=UPI001BACA3E5|nr:DUF4255 domain-containing protein [Kutzneria sp. CA-103260]QUQ65645.1 hypothetical protein JJ691_33690 [Kutzneria sp. CA-103260]
MSGYLALNTVSRSLRRILAAAYEADPMVNSLVNGENGIVFSNPTETARDPSKHLSLWLYRITENEFMKNIPAVAEPNRNQSRPSPLALDLSYLVTPFTSSGENDQVLIGKTMQVLHDNSSVYVRDQLNAVIDEVRVVFCRLPLEEVTRIWEALQEPYRLSVCYLVRVFRVDSTTLDESAPVLDITTGEAAVAG